MRLALGRLALLVLFAVLLLAFLFDKKIFGWCLFWFFFQMDGRPSENTAPDRVAQAILLIKRIRLLDLSVGRPNHCFFSSAFKSFVESLSDAFIENSFEVPVVVLTHL